VSRPSAPSLFSRTTNEWSSSPTFLGGGVRLFEGIDKNAVDVSIMDVMSSPKVTHLRYALKKKR
jgi:hypothetical protein